MTKSCSFRLSRRLPIVLLLASLSACDGLGAWALLGGGDEWPLEVHLSADVQVSEVESNPRNVWLRDLVPPALSTAHIVPGIWPAAEVFLSADRELVLVQFDEGAKWVETPAPLSPTARRFLLGLAGEGAIHLQFFEDGDRAIANSAAGIHAVRLSTARDRMLDYRGATLEGCRMSNGRLSYECSLDLSWDHASFDPDGVETNGNYQPAWTY